MQDSSHLVAPWLLGELPEVAFNTSVFHLVGLDSPHPAAGEAGKCNIHPGSHVLS